MVKVVVLASIPYIRGQGRREFLGFVTRNEIDNVVGNQCREPAHALPGDIQIIGNPNRSSGHDLDAARVSARRLGASLNKTQAPRDEVRIGELQDYAVGDAASKFQYLGAIPGNPDRRCSSCPRQPDVSFLIVHRLSSRAITEVFYGLNETV